MYLQKQYMIANCICFLKKCIYKKCTLKNIESMYTKRGKRPLKNSRNNFYSFMINFVPYQQKAKMYVLKKSANL